MPHSESPLRWLEDLARIAKKGNRSCAIIYEGVDPATGKDTLSDYMLKR